MASYNLAIVVVVVVVGKIIAKEFLKYHQFTNRS